MTRPTYETERDKQNERRVAEAAAEMWNAELKQNPPKYAIDYCFQRNRRTQAFVEIRCRKRTFDQYPTMFLGLKKAIEGMTIADCTGLPFIFLVEFTDGVYWCKVKREYLSVISYRDDIDWRGDPQDKEPIVLLPMEAFRPLKQLSRLDGLKNESCCEDKALVGRNACGDKEQASAAAITGYF